MDLVIDIYKLTSNFPHEEKFGLMAQSRRAAVSIPSNISEGAARKGKKEFINFLYIALGSLAELETQLEIALRLEYYTPRQFDFTRLSKIRQMLLGLIGHLKKR